MENVIQVEASISADRNKVWELWTSPEHIVNWNFASTDWHCPRAQNDLRIHGMFNYKMASKDGQAEFEFMGVHDHVEDQNLIKSHLADGRLLVVEFKQDGNQTKICESFEPEPNNSEDLQRQGWQAILNNFKTYAESRQNH
ncbi:MULTISPECIES: SRPBCC domain-containing protein [unclassified Saccharicrinis]|uniref:SRPBCC domain-containing protein n=1 Tax=unclassified Saccharicrinis TaxID=2646859 RepID=UPI003D33F8C6